jgi:hypothetical protein
MPIFQLTLVTKCLFPKSVIRVGTLTEILGQRIHVFCMPTKQWHLQLAYTSKVFTKRHSLLLGKGYMQSKIALRTYVSARFI